MPHPPRPQAELLASLVFSTADIAQISEIEHVFRAAFTPYVRRLGRDLNDTSYSWLSSSVAAGDVCAGLLDGRVICVAATARLDDDLYIEQLAVDPDHQNTGVGSWLLDRIEDKWRAEGFRTISLDTALMMTDLLRFYDRAGFEIRRRGPPKHGRDSHIRVYLSKPLQK